MRQVNEQSHRSPLVSLASSSQSADLSSLDGAIYADQAIIGWPHAWQRPAATEEAAWNSVRAGSAPQGWFYVGFPWATLIDGLERKAPLGWRLLRKLEDLRKKLAAKSSDAKIATVCQHIHAASFTELFKRIGVTDLFWSHAIESQPELDGINIHGFPLYPAQIGDKMPQIDPEGSRKWLANFIGAFNAEIYLSDVRARIFEDIDHPDLLIIKREGWHFDRAVYAQQIAGVDPDLARLALEEKQKEEYLDAIRGSRFTLCPTGSGPNSIRIYEALALGSIPIILTRDLALPGDPALWKAACVFEDDSAEGYSRACVAIRAMTDSEICVRQAAIPKLFGTIGPRGYSGLIKNFMTSNVCTD